MAESKLRTLSIDFAVQILNLVKFLKSQHETIVSNQIGRAGTSIGANIHEAQYAHGKADFIVGGRSENAGKFLSSPAILKGFLSLKLQNFAVKCNSENSFTLVQKNSEYHQVLY